MGLNRQSSDGLGVVAVVDHDSGDGLDPPEVVAHLDPAVPWSLRSAIERLSDYDVVIAQHEYGIWGPDMGRPVLELADRLENRLITTLHTLLPEPTPVQETIIETLAQLSAHTVVPTRAAKRLLTRRYEVDPRSVVVIPHGTDAPHRSVARLRATRPRPNRPPTLLTWGLIGPGKGLEWSLRAVGALKQTYPDLRYTIAGRTHPKVLANDGERYRRHLEGIVAELGLEENVRFIDDYLPEEMLHRLLFDATIVVLPYDSTDQIVSGVLVEAVSANVPVVATAFSHALELAEANAVTTVPQQSPEAIASSIGRLLDTPMALDAMVRAQRGLAPELEWVNVASRYEALVGEVVRGAVAMSHVPTAS